MESAVVPSDLLFGIYKFLTEHELKKTAKTLRKEVSLDTTNDCDIDLLELYRKFSKRKRKRETQPECSKKLKLSEEVIETPETVETEVTEIAENVTPFQTDAIKKQKKKKKKKQKLKNGSDETDTTIFTNQANFTGFRRVNTDISQVNPMLRDNSFAKKVVMGGSDKIWGKKACDDFRNTSGKSFRHEKTKKKRGSYKGGSIGMEVCSYKFSVSEDSD